MPPLFKDKPNAAQRKAQLAAVAAELAAQLEYDGRQENPLVANTTEVLSKFQLMNKYAYRGEVVAPPGFGEAVAAVTKSQLEPGGEGHALSEEVDGATYRDRAVGIFKAIAAVLE